MSVFFAILLTVFVAQSILNRREKLSCRVHSFVIYIYDRVFSISSHLLRWIWIWVLHVTDFFLFSPALFLVTVLGYQLWSVHLWRFVLFASVTQMLEISWRKLPWMGFGGVRYYFLWFFTRKLRHTGRPLNPFSPNSTGRILNVGDKLFSCGHKIRFGGHIGTTRILRLRKLWNTVFSDIRGDSWSLEFLQRFFEIRGKRDSVGVDVRVDQFASISEIPVLKSK